MNNLQPVILLELEKNKIVGVILDYSIENLEVDFAWQVSLLKAEVSLQGFHRFVDLWSHHEIVVGHGTA